MPYTVVYDTRAEQARRRLPMTARASLRLKLNSIVRDLESGSVKPGSGSRTAPFGGNSQGLVVNIDTARRLITVTDILWAK